MSRDGFGSKLGIIAAAAGSAVGLGNIYRFPCELGNNGGGAFLLVYLLIVLGLGVPVMLSEFVIGRKTQKNPIGAFKMLKPKSGWPIIGYMGVGCALVIMAFYSTVAGWTLEYIVKAVGNQFKDKDLATIEQEFTAFHDIGWKNVLWQGIFIFLTAFVVFKGVADGIEKYSKVLMPLLVVILIVLAVRSITLPGAGDGLTFLFKPDFSKITGSVLISALGQAFFSLSIDNIRLVYQKRRQHGYQCPFSDPFRYADCCVGRCRDFPGSVFVRGAADRRHGFGIQHLAYDIQPDGRRVLFLHHFLCAFGRCRPDIHHFPVGSHRGISGRRSSHQ